MTRPAVKRKPGLKRARPAAVTAGLALLLAACSEVPDWANPIEWYHDTADAVDSVFSGEDEEQVPPPEQAQEQAAPEIAAAGPAEPAPVPGAEEPFPNLATVPEEPPAVMPPEEVEQLMTGLAADRENAKYTDQVLRGETEEQPAAPPQLPPAPNANVPVTAEALPAAPPASGQSLGQSPSQASAPAQPLAQPLAQPAPQPQTYAGTPAGEPLGIEDFKQRFNQALAASGATTLAGTPGAASNGGTFETAAAQPAGAQGTNYAALDGAAPPGLPSAVVSFLAAVVYFGNGQAWLSGQDRAMLEDVADLYDRTGGYVRVVGHASQRTRDMEYARHKLANFELSSERAQIVADEMIRHGVPADRIVVTAAGDDEPSSYEFMPAGEAENRRTEIFIEY